ncbi:TetR/AcrR family transcriptional regulator [Mycolicibacter hiberniae]|uniref:TetR/AcrR family transcriptional regulator n=1 Tax=Mycolicibacter hiberniae TaxID=29314 RepID=UPI000A156D6E|nr:TetR/AcrR family transcriptional regulator [Mycolicibacter hiberniae]MCV7088132.1 TetR/AcrR family transcriptional regulator [Mycolicibacter hiberniae]ORV72457.1 TetR family transcriptional regulator [Mycolicibacter hiberniae]
MKAEPSALDKAPGAGRPRDPRIDAAILQAAAELVVEVGYANLSLAAVAERAGTTKTALYRRWPSKAELVHEAVFSVPPSAVIAVPGNAFGILQAMMAGARDAFTDPAVRAALPGLFADMSTNAELTARVLSRFQGLFEVTRHWVAESVSRGDLRAGVDAGRLVEIIGGAALFSMMLRPQDALDDDWVHQTADIIALGVLT